MSKKKAEGKRTEEQAERGSSFFDPASCCGPMIERMMEAFSESAGEREGPSGTATGGGRRASCRSMMQQMMETCVRSRTGEDKSKSGTEETRSRC